MRAIIFGLIAVAVTIPDLSQADTPCDKLSRAIARSKLTAMQAMMTEMGDDSAVRATQSELMINNALLLIQINLTLMIQARCPTPTDPIDFGRTP